MGPSDRSDRLRWRAASLLAATPVSGLAATVPPEPPQMAAAQPAEARHALARELQRRLLAGGSATAALERWCAEQGLAPAGRVRAVRIRGTAPPEPAPAAVRAALEVDDSVRLHYRRVHLVCGERVLSSADNWYLPDRLTAAMNDTLDRTDEPFGRVVAALGFERHTLGHAPFWPPRPDPGGAVLLEVRALLRDGQRRPFSYVVENYREQALP